MRRLDWFLAAIVATFLLAVAVIETASVATSAVGVSMARSGAVGEVAMRRLVTRLPHPDLMTIDPR